MTTAYSRSMASAWQYCHDFNSQYPIGTRVNYRPISGSIDGQVETTTRSVAWVLPNGHAVVMINGKSGGVSLENVEVVK